MRYYTVRALLFEFCRILNLSMEVPNVYIAIWSFVEFWRGGGGGGGPKILYGEIPQTLMFYYIETDTNN